MDGRRTPRPPRRGRVRARSRATGAALLALAGAALPRPAAAQLVVWDGGDASLGLGGYVRALTGVSRAAFELPGRERATAFNADVLRLEWDLRLGDGAVLEVHDRAQLQLTSQAAAPGGGLAGFGVSRVPGRTVDLRTDFVERPRVRAWHDVDRLSLTLQTGAGDLTAGRQAVTWGVSTLFPVADLWTAFSPFELDASEKPGVDAVRFLAYPGGWEVDAVVADRGNAEDLSAGVRGTLVLPWADVWVGAGKLWREAMVMGGVSAPVGSWKLRGEAVLAHTLEDDPSGRERGPGWQRPRLTVGVDWLGGGVLVTGEYHHNPLGAADPDGYAAALASPAFGRGETYYLGRDYLGGLVSWAPGNDRLALALTGIVNLRDPSSAWTPVVTWDAGRSARLSAGAVLTTGPEPRLSPDDLAAPSLASEYGTYGQTLFTRVSVWF